MQIVYCKKCNHFSCQSKTSNYCRECKNPVIHPDITPEEYFNMSVNDRYRLAYTLSHEK